MRAEGGLRGCCVLRWQSTGGPWLYSGDAKGREDRQRERAKQTGEMHGAGLHLRQHPRKEARADMYTRHRQDTATMERCSRQAWAWAWAWDARSTRGTQYVVEGRRPAAWSSGARVVHKLTSAVQCSAPMADGRPRSFPSGGGSHETSKLRAAANQDTFTSETCSRRFQPRHLVLLDRSRESLHRSTALPHLDVREIDVRCLKPSACGQTAPLRASSPCDRLTRQTAQVRH